MTFALHRLITHRSLDRAAVGRLIEVVAVTFHLKYNPLPVTMLSGIKTGKRKKRKTANDGAAAVTSLPEMSAPSQPKKRPAASSDGNLSAAQLLKQQLKSGNIPPTKHKGGLEARLERIAESTETNGGDSKVVVLTGAAAATTSDRPDYRPGTYRRDSRE
jgi:hypothetical protein